MSTLSMQLAWAMAGVTGDASSEHPNTGIDPAIRMATEYCPPFSAAHMAAVLFAAAAVAAVVIAGRRLRPDGPRGADGQVIDAAGRVLGMLALVHWAAYQAWWNIPVRFALSTSLPLHVCDLAALASALALITGKRWLSVITYFWGLSLCTQAFVTPTVGWGPTYTEYWTFWEAHTAAVGGAAYVVFVRGLRPRLRDLLFAYGALVAYTAVVLPVDLLTGWNYGYVGKSDPSSATLIDALGPWPWRLVPMALLAALGMTVFWIPWLFVRPRSDGAACGRLGR
jgi:hypothetical integral membrane protein (TIGR02206 family)